MARQDQSDRYRADAEANIRGEENADNEIKGEIVEAQLAKDQRAAQVGEADRGWSELIQKRDTGDGYVAVQT